MKLTPQDWYILGHEMGEVHKKLTKIRITFLNNYGPTNYYYKLCQCLQNELIPKLENELTNKLLAEYENEYKQDNKIDLRDIFHNLNRHSLHEIDSMYNITHQYSRTLEKKLKSEFLENLDYIIKYIDHIHDLFFDNNDKLINQIFIALHKLNNVLHHNIVYE
ncbi:hypothetical protein QKU48_gp1022 [Fadolivirus algeromassiliense]|jgi:hypothetical protein|uniref:Uncharacterized protein n=1 Tax=Fadolivirus FV1/VV64 TaxID=3070911 RepID=A0A7D3QXH1_9VIRU|nr:hypothetical protein QKU48_gp1022 [Fadolivirus algeromassiliense]QKF94480.1 hypothetical protein Fadolivirus_1_1022 [Fadolivirus FV1/VV64]